MTYDRWNRRGGANCRSMKRADLDETENWRNFRRDGRMEKMKEEESGNRFEKEKKERRKGRIESGVDWRDILGSGMD